MNNNYYEKYLKYKNKYLLLKNQFAGDNFILDYKTIENYLNATGVYSIQNYDIINNYLTEDNDTLLQKIPQIYDIKSYKYGNNIKKLFVNFKNFIGNGDIQKEKIIRKRLYDIIFFTEVYPNNKLPLEITILEKTLIKNYRKMYDYQKIISEFIVDDLLIKYDFVVQFYEEYISFKDLLSSLKDLQNKNLLEQQNTKYIDLYLLYQDLLVLYYQVFITHSSDPKIDMSYLNENQTQLKETNINIWSSLKDDTKHYLLFLLMEIIDKDDKELKEKIDIYYQETMPINKDKIIDLSLFNYKLQPEDTNLIKYYVNNDKRTKKFYMCTKNNTSEIVTKDKFISKIKEYRDTYSLKERNIYNINNNINNNNIINKSRKQRIRRNKEKYHKLEHYLDNNLA